MAATLRLSCAAILTLGVSLPAWAGCINVPGDRPTIQAGIDFAGFGGCVEVEAGIYVENIDFDGKAVTVRSVEGPEKTIIEGSVKDCKLEDGCPVVTFKSGEETDSILDGFTIMNGNADEGGGIFIENSSPTITECIIVDNFARHGGGAFIRSGSPVFDLCEFQTNDADAGGGIYMETVADEPPTAPLLMGCTFFLNTATATEMDGGGMYTKGLEDAPCQPMLIECTFDMNSSLDDGGGYFCSEFSRPDLQMCVFRDNIAIGSGGDGGGMVNTLSSVARLTDCTFEGNDSGNDGGGMMNRDESQVMLTRCMFINNQSPADQGGALLNRRADAEIRECTFRDNIASDGGAINNVDQSTLFISESAFEDNIATNSGGAITSLFSSSALIIGSTFDGNVAEFRGGAIYDNALYDIANDVRIAACDFTDNRAIDGGAMYCWFGAQRIDDCTFTLNLADLGGNGAGLYNDDGSQVVSNCRFIGNIADDDGGGVYNLDGDDRSVASCLFLMNDGGLGGGMFVRGSSTDIATCTFDQNTSSRGALYNLMNMATIVDCVFRDNTSTVQGGGMYNTGGTTAEVENARFERNISPDGGGMYNVIDSQPTVKDSTFCENSVGDILPDLSWVDKGGNMFLDECPIISCVGDITGDGIVDFGDIIPLLVAWGPCPGCPADLNLDGVVDFGDIVVLLMNWGPCPI